MTDNTSQLPGEGGENRLQQSQQKEERIFFSITIGVEQRYSICADLVNGEAREVSITDSEDSEVSLPLPVLLQLIAAVNTQEQMRRAALLQAQQRQFLNHPTSLPVGASLGAAGLGSTAQSQRQLLY